jgi:hypothetical protein
MLPNEIGDFYEQMGLIKLGKKENLKAVGLFTLCLSARKRVANKHGEASSLQHLLVSLFRTRAYLQFFISLMKTFKLFYHLNVLNHKRICRIISLFWEC